MEKQRIKSERISGRRLLIVLFLLSSFPVFSQTLTSAMIRELRISPVENQQLQVNTDIKFETVIPYTLPSQIDLSMPEENDEMIFKTLRKVEWGGGTKIEIWFLFTKTGTYTPKPLLIKIKNSRRQIQFDPRQCCEGCRNKEEENQLEYNIYHWGHIHIGADTFPLGFKFHKTFSIDAETSSA